MSGGELGEGGSHVPSWGGGQGACIVMSHASWQWSHGTPPPGQNYSQKRLKTLALILYSLPSMTEVPFGERNFLDAAELTE